jgi:hypothetical protein
MNSGCAEYREALRAHFDNGDDQPITHDHVHACQSCAAYRNELIALHVAFAAMPLEMPRNALAQRVKARLAAEPAFANDVRWWMPATIACSVALLVALTVYFAVPIDPWTWWDYASRPAATPQWMLGEMSFTGELLAAQAYWNDFSGVFRGVSTRVLWSVAALAALFLAGLNGAKAYRLRHHPMHQHTWR